MRFQLDLLIFNTPLGNWISHLVGCIMQIPIPTFLRPLVFKTFSFMFSVDLLEVEKPLSSYSSINSFFTRHLIPGCRPLKDSTVILPSDGYLTQSNTFSASTLFQAKNINYSLQELIPNCSISTGSTLTIYLSPKDCHHVFSPIDGNVTKISFIPGRLFPVREPYISKHSTLYTRNERLIFELNHLEGTPLYVVMIGAMNVGSMSTPYFNNNQPVKVEGQHKPTHTPIYKGDVLGTFHLGSTVILISPDSDALSHFTTGNVLRGS